MAYLSDQPIRTATMDRFDRSTFAKRIAETIKARTDASGIVLSIDGPWGGGKSTVLEFVEKELEGGVIVVRFNPWRYAAEEVLLIKFFQKLADEIGVSVLGKGNRLRRFVDEQCPWATDLAGMGWKSIATALLLPPAAIIASSTAASKFWTMLSPNVDKLHERMKSELEQKRRTVVVMVDDVDRLDSSDLFSLFRLVKLTADFPYLTYLLAMDHKAIKKSIAKRFSEDQRVGESFLEKIIQVPLKLPAIPKAKLETYLWEQIKAVLNTVGMTISNAEWARLVHGYRVLIALRISTPRAAKQYANVVHFAMGVLPNEINIVDLVLLEGLRVFFGELFEVVMMNDDLLFDRNPLFEFRPSTPSAIERICDKFTKLPMEVSKGLSLLLGILFPHLSEHVNVTMEHLESWELDKRVADEMYFMRYQTYAIAGEDVADAKVDTILQLLEEQSFDRFEQIIFTETGNPGLTFRRLRLRLKTISEESRDQLASQIARIKWEKITALAGSEYDSTIGKAAVVAEECIELMETFDTQVALFKKVVDLSDSAYWIYLVFRVLPLHRENDSHDEVEKFRYDVEQTRAVFDVAAKKLETMIVEGGVQAMEPNAGGSYWILLRSGRESLVKRAIEDFCEADPHYCLKVLEYSMGTSTSGNESWHIWDGSRTLERADKYISRDLLTRCLKQVIDVSNLQDVTQEKEDVSIEEAAQFALARLTRATTP